MLEQHLVCAALEHPLSLLYDEKYFGSGLNSAITSLTNRGYLSFDPSRGSSSRIWNYIGHAVNYLYPWFKPDLLVFQFNKMCGLTLHSVIVPRY